MAAMPRGTVSLPPAVSSSGWRTWAGRTAARWWASSWLCSGSQCTLRPWSSTSQTTHVRLGRRLLSTSWVPFPRNFPISSRIKTNSRRRLAVSLDRASRLTRRWAGWIGGWKSEAHRSIDDLVRSVSVLTKVTESEKEATRLGPETRHYDNLGSQEGGGWE